MRVQLRGVEGGLLRNHPRPRTRHDGIDAGHDRWIVTIRAMGDRVRISRVLAEDRGPDSSCNGHLPDSGEPVTRLGRGDDRPRNAVYQPCSIHPRSSSLRTGLPATTSAISRRRLPSRPTRDSWPPCTSSMRSPHSWRASAARRASPTSEPANPRAVDRFSVRAGQNLPMVLSFSRIRRTTRRRLS